MSNYIDYLKWRGDVPFSAAPFCEVDAMILSELAYINMDGLVRDDFSFAAVSKNPKARRKTADSTEQESNELFSMSHSNVPTCADICLKHTTTTEPKNSLEENLYNLADAVLTAPRIADIRIAGYISKTDTDQQMQFAAATFMVAPRQYFAAFRGTDNSLVGWKENMDLSYHEEVPSQKAAVSYLNEAVKNLSGKFMVGGHSKGGNLAVYATAFSYKKTSKKVTAVYNFDGPGFNDKVIAKDRFRDIEDRVFTYVPQNSLVGMLLKHNEPYTVIKSSKVSGINEHQMDSWAVGPRQIEREADLGSMGKILNENIQEWLDSMTYDEKEQFINVVYDLVDDYETVENLFSAKNLVAILKEYSSLSDENKQKVSGVLDSLSDTVRGNILEFIQDRKDSVQGKLSDINRRLRR